MEENKLYMVSIYSENHVGLMSSISNIFTRRSLNIESMTVFPSEFPGIHHWIIRTYASRPMIGQVIKQIEKKIDVIYSCFYEPESYLEAEHDRVTSILMERRQNSK